MWRNVTDSACGTDLDRLLTTTVLQLVSNMLYSVGSLIRAQSIVRTSLITLKTSLRSRELHEGMYGDLKAV